MARKSGCAGYRLSRRQALLNIGSLGVGGLTLPGLLRADKASAAGPSKSPKHCIFLFLSGGAAHQETFDPKPEAPLALRGTHKAIETNVPGMRINEYMPRLAKMADKFSIIRSMHHSTGSHPAGFYWMITGRKYSRASNLSAYLSREDMPHFGSAVSYLLPPEKAGVPGFVTIPDFIKPNVSYRSGQHAGFLGPKYDPLIITNRASSGFMGDEKAGEFDRGGVSLIEGLTPSRVVRRKQLLESVEARGGHELRPEYARAFDLLTANGVGQAFDVGRESAATRERYGKHLFGQGCLLARRLVEAGVRLVCVNWIRVDGGRGGQGFDSHSKHLDWAKTELNPGMDAAIPSLLADLDDRGMLEDTLVVAVGEFGRTPKFNKNGGRDHWPHVFSVFMAGGGIKGGQVLGKSDHEGAYPDGEAFTPGDMAATMHHCLGLDPETLVYDQLDRPFTISDGEVLHQLL